MNYQLNKEKKEKKEPFLDSIKRLGPLMKGEQRYLIITGIAVIFSSLATLVIPVIIAHTIDTYIAVKDYHGILINSAILFWIFIVGSTASYIQTKSMGGVGRRVLFRLRNAVFTKLQELPVAFFNQNKAGDLISRINNDTDKLNQFFSQALMQFFGNFFLILGSGIFILVLNFRLGIMVLLPAFWVFVITNLLSAWVKKRNLESLQSTGGMSSEIQESLNHFKVIIAFNRLDYFRKKFEEFNAKNYTASIRAGVASTIFVPIYSFASNLAQLIALCYGIYLITTGNITLGLLIGFQFYVTNFYTPLRQLASVWSSFQLALASLDRVSEVLLLNSDMEVMEDKEAEHNYDKKSDTVLEFRDVSFAYPQGDDILKHISFSLLRWKTYALVGPTGGGKTTTASLMARLYDPTKGKILLDGRDMRSYDAVSRTQNIGFILQEPFLFVGTVRENILYGNEMYASYDSLQMTKLLKKMGLVELLEKFDQGLETQVSSSGESISLGQKQLLAFMRAILRNPKILILDEATANIDTITEQLLEKMLENLPKDTIKVIIAHRLNTIKNADEIFFVNAGTIVNTGNMEHALDMLLHGKRAS